MSVVESGEGRTRGEYRTGMGKRTKLAFLGIDKLVEHLAATLARAGARTVQTVVQDRTVRVVVNQEEMATAFATLVARGAAVTIHGGSVPIKAGEETAGKGCALLSISVRAERSVEGDPSGDVLPALRGIIRKHSGSFRLGRRPGEMRLKLYLPVLYGV